MGRRVIGISPGTRHFGLAVLQDGRMLDWKVFAFAGAWSGTKLQIIIDSLRPVLEESRADAVGVKIPDALPISTSYIQLVGALNAFIERQHIVPMYYNLSELKKHWCPGQGITKATLAECIVAKHHELLPEYRKEQTNKNSYYTKLFEAVAAADHAHKVYMLSHTD